MVILLVTPSASPSQAAGIVPTFLGVIPGRYINGDAIVELYAMGAWAGKASSLVEISLDIQETNGGYDIPTQLNFLWDYGYTPFINLVANIGSPSAYQIAAGVFDNALNQWAQIYANWAQAGKWAFIAILPEMNVPWYSYGMDAANYLMAFTHIRQVFVNGARSSLDGSPAFQEANPEQYLVDDLKTYIPAQMEAANVPGVSTIFGALMMAPAFQLVFGSRRLWVPRRVREWRVSCEALRRTLNTAPPALGRIEYLIKPRWSALTRFPLTIFAGLQTLLMGFILILPIPFANWPPGMTVAMTSLALPQHDDVLMLLTIPAAVASVASVYLGTRFGLAAINVLVDWFNALF